ncbi:hypothetical protein [Demequina activiva]|uniref:Fis family transcriptional regulator n=1 Tax=Demequina activiva TaxID=1582364 RepID=A0A919Q4H8_9MICO|nr:hypothetical protein [Demequina activiva]GIG55409.1 hypothetical protein Dac01nite_21610 [Demequina activiva]
MRWEALFRDLEAQADAQADEQWRHEVAERTRGERASVTVAARVAAARGGSVSAVLRDGTRVSGVLVDSGGDWALVTDGGRQHLVSLASVAVLDGLPRRADVLSAVESRLSIAHALRALSRERARVAVRTGVEVAGVIVGVGADHINVLTDAGVTTTVPLASILEVAQG